MAITHGVPKCEVHGSSLAANWRHTVQPRREMPSCMVMATHFEPPRAHRLPNLELFSSHGLIDEASGHLDLEISDQLAPCEAPSVSATRIRLLNRSLTKSTVPGAPHTSSADPLDVEALALFSKTIHRRAKRTLGARNIWSAAPGQAWGLDLAPLTNTLCISRRGPTSFAACASQS